MKPKVLCLERLIDVESLPAGLRKEMIKRRLIRVKEDVYEVDLDRTFFFNIPISINGRFIECVSIRVKKSLYILVNDYANNVDVKIFDLNI